MRWGAVRWGPEPIHRTARSRNGRSPGFVGRSRGGIRAVPDGGARQGYGMVGAVASDRQTEYRPLEKIEGVGMPQSSGQVSALSLHSAGRWAGYAACVCAFLFAATSFYWGTGGTLGLDLVGREAVELVASGKRGDLDRPVVGGAAQSRWWASRARPGATLGGSPVPAVDVASGGLGGAAWWSSPALHPKAAARLLTIDRLGATAHDRRRTAVRPPL